MGRPRKPTDLKVLHGDFEKNPSKENKREPKPKFGKPICPEWLQGDARTQWGIVCELLTDMGVLTVDCGPALEQYCISYKLMRAAFRHVDEHGLVMVRTDAAGNKHAVRNPHAVELREHSATCIRLLTEFGLTPASRTRVQIEEQVSNAMDTARKYLT